MPADAGRNIPQIQSRTGFAVIVAKNIGGFVGIVNTALILSIKTRRYGLEAETQGGVLLFKDIQACFQLVVCRIAFWSGKIIFYLILMISVIFWHKV